MTNVLTTQLYATGSARVSGITNSMKYMTHAVMFAVIHVKEVGHVYLAKITILEKRATTNAKMVILWSCRVYAMKDTLALIAS